MGFHSANKGHFDQIIAMVKSPEELYLFHPKGTYPLDHAQLDALLEKRSNVTVVVEEGEVVGFANLYDVCPQESAFIGNVVVSAHHRGKGIGKGLTQYMCEVCINQYGASPHLSVFNVNTRALLLYSTLGFKPYSVEQRVNLQEEPVALIHMKYEQ